MIPGCLWVGNHQDPQAIPHIMVDAGEHPPGSVAVLVEASPTKQSAGGAVAISSLRRVPECHPSMPRLADRNGRLSTLKCDCSTSTRSGPLSDSPFRLLMP